MSKRPSTERRYVEVGRHHDVLVYTSIYIEIYPRGKLPLPKPVKMRFDEPRQ
jgi:hypothetical protein